MVDPAAGDVGLGSSAAANAAAATAQQRAAEEAQRKAAADAAAKAAAEERARALAAERLRDRLEAADGGTPYRAKTVATVDLGGGPVLGDPPPPPNQTVPVDPRQGAQGVVDDWATTGGSELGLRNPMVYEEYLSRHEGTMLGVARGITGAAPDASALGVGPDVANQLTAPAVEYLSAQNPNATFRVLGVEESPIPSGFGVTPGRARGDDDRARRHAPVLRGRPT